MMKLFIEIGSAVNVVINLSEDGDNQVAIQGGGNLIYSMNPEGGNNLVGKYTLSGGMVRYAIPVVGEKILIFEVVVMSNGQVLWKILPCI